MTNKSKLKRRANSKLKASETKSSQKYGFGGRETKKRFTNHKRKW